MKIMSYSFSKKTINKILFASGIILIIIVIFYIYNKLLIKERFNSGNSQIDALQKGLKENLPSIESNLKKTSVDDLNNIEFGPLQDLAYSVQFGYINEDLVRDWIGSIKNENILSISTFLDNIGSLQTSNSLAYPDFVNFFSNEQLRGLKKTQMNDIIYFLNNRSDTSFLTTDQIVGIDIVIIPRLSKFLNSLSIANFQKLTTEQIQAIKPEQIYKIPNFVNYLSDAQKKILTDEQKNTIKIKSESKIIVQLKSPCDSKRICDEGYICDIRNKICRLGKVGESCKVQNEKDRKDTCEIGKCDRKEFKCKLLGVGVDCKKPADCLSKKCEQGIKTGIYTCRKGLVGTACKVQNKNSCKVGYCAPNSGDEKTTKEGEGTCKFRKPGEAVNVDNRLQCGSEKKKDGKCIASEIGGNCNANIDCKIGRCSEKEKKCELIPDGNACDSNSSCKSTLCGTYKTCHTIPTGNDADWNKQEYCSLEDTKAYIHTDIPNATLGRWYKYDIKKAISNEKISCCKVGMNKQWGEAYACNRLNGKEGIPCTHNRDCGKLDNKHLKCVTKDEDGVGYCRL